LEGETGLLKIGNQEKGKRTRKVKNPGLDRGREGERKKARDREMCVYSLGLL